MTGHPEIAALLKRTMGLDIASVGAPALDQAVRRRLTELGTADEPTYLEELERSESELQELIDAVVVPETWFFREPEAFHLLGELAGKALQRQRPLRLLSLPCSTGEEPYSIAMALLDLGMTPRDFRVDAVDISKRALETAARGVYRRHSFRGADLGFRDRHFRPAVAGYELEAKIRECVHFQHGNLLAPDFLEEVQPFDFVFCRNVLIYFDAHTQETAIRTIKRLLAEHGTLFVGPAEAFVVRGSGFTSRRHARAFAFHRAPEPAPAVGGPVRRSKISAKAKARPAATSRTPLIKSEAAPDSNDLDTAKRLADAGRLAEAMECCERHLQEHGDSADAHFLLGLVHDAMEDGAQAARCYRKAVYLEHNHAEALLHLALLTEKAGDSTAAKRLKKRAQRIEEEASR